MIPLLTPVIFRETAPLKSLYGEHNSAQEIKEAKDVPKIRDLSSLTEQMKRKVPTYATLLPLSNPVLKIGREVTLMLLPTYLHLVTFTTKHFSKIKNFLFIYFSYSFSSERAILTSTTL